ncbi:hypothetical protein MS3_00000629 [Schistosoma haematobium]|uniref:Uncharacterized protein n=1 Tax=Schistosoma haematobium TaxID=6185 RepID=A0A922S5S3_SCHHA|nr:hypothetical protein MS3_00000629 [Schistosoma haematobium]KAH9594917.1 hypothetical protein MS3_00000629 [Schistosoma haematobium]
MIIMIVGRIGASKVFHLWMSDLIFPIPISQSLIVLFYEFKQYFQNAELKRLKLARAAEIAYIKEKNELALKCKEDETEIEKSRFISMVNALGADTLRAMATAESDHNLSMLNALGLQSTLITDGTTPVNLLTTAHGLIGSVFKGSSRKRTSEVLDDVDEK